MENIKISVVIPAYNCEEFLSQTIESVLKQTYKPFEIIIINDGSTDKTEEIANNYSSQVTVITQKNAGVSSARNTGFKATKGDWIAFIDGDDIWLPDKLSLQVTALEDFPESILIFNEFVSWSVEKSGHYPSPNTYIKDYHSPHYDQTYTGWVYHKMLLKNWVLTSTSLIKKSALINTGGFNEVLPVAEDWDIFIKLSTLGQFCKIAHVLTLYRQLPNSLSSKVKNIDYASMVLDQAIHKYGYNSPDGTEVDRKDFKWRSYRRHFNYGLGCIEQKLYRQAVSAFRKAIRYNPWSYKAWLFWGAAHFQTIKTIEGKNDK